MSKEDDSKVKKEKLLIVEGIDEVSVISKIFENNRIDDVQLIPFGGKNRLPGYLKNVLTKDPNFHSVSLIGIVRDADNDAEGAFKSVCSALQNSGLDIPTEVNVKTNGKPSIIVLILPGNNKAGSLEDIFIDSVKGKPVMQCVEDYFKCVHVKQGSIPTQIGKAKVHTYLASHVNDSDKRFGESVQAGLWNLNHGAFNIIHEFLKQL